MTKKQSILNYAQGAPMQKEPDYSKLTDDEVRALYAIQKRLEAECLPLTVESLTPEEKAILNQLNSKL